MPIARELRKYYGYRWTHVDRPESLRLAGGRFDKGKYVGGAHCQRCKWIEHQVDGRSKLEVAHLDGDPVNRAVWNRAVLCHRCHRAHDYKPWAAKYRATRLANTQRRKDAARPLFRLLEPASSQKGEVQTDGSGNATHGAGRLSPAARAL